MDGNISSDAGGVSINDTVDIVGLLSLANNLSVDGTAAITSTLDVNGAVTLNTTLDVDGNVSSGTGAFAINDTLNVVGAVNLDSTLDVDGNTDITGTLQYGANNLYPLGYVSSGYQAVYGTSLITGTAVAAHGLTTVTFALCTLGEDPTNGGGDGAMCTVTVAANVVTVKVWQDDFVTAATEVDVDVHWFAIGLP